jgi:hypothetical protein
MLRALLLALLLSSNAALASPALHGTWSAAVDGQPLVVTFNADGSGAINGAPMRWQTMMRLLFVQPQGGQVVTYSFGAQGDTLSVSGGDLPGIVALTRGTAAAQAARPQTASGPTATDSGAAASAGRELVGRELVGRWCKVTNFSANAGGGSQNSTCFELRPDGSYVYQQQGSMSANAPGMWGGTTSQSSDAGRWSVHGNRITAHSRSGQVNSYALEKRNHPRNPRDPMICLDGECYVTFHARPAW